MKHTWIFTALLFPLLISVTSGQEMVWEPSTGFPVRPASTLQFFPEATSVQADGKTLLLYCVSTEENLESRVQLIDENGDQLWGEGGVVFDMDNYRRFRSVAFPDGGWGVAWGTTLRQYQRYSSTGVPYTTPYRQLQVEDAEWSSSTHSVLDVWQTSENKFMMAFLLRDQDSEYRLHFQCFDQYGNFLWAVSDPELFDPDEILWSYDKHGYLYIAMDWSIPLHVSTLFRKYNLEGVNVWGGDTEDNGIILPEFIVSSIYPDQGGGLLVLGDYEAEQELVVVPSWTIDETSITHRTPVHNDPSIEIRRIHPVSSTTALLEGIPHPLGGDENALAYPFYKIRLEREVWVDAWSHPFLHGSWVDEDENPVFRFMDDGEGGAWLAWRDGGDSTTTLSHMLSNGTHGEDHLELPIQLMPVDVLECRDGEFTIAWQETDSLMNHLLVQQVDVQEMGWEEEPLELETCPSGQVEHLQSVATGNRLYSAWIERNENVVTPIITAQDRLSGELLFEEPQAVAPSQWDDPRVDSWWKIQLIPLSDGMLAVWSKRWLEGSLFGYKLTAQKISHNGERHWGESGSVVLDEMSTSLQTPEVIACKELEDGSVVLLLSGKLAGNNLSPVKRSVIEEDGTVSCVAEVISQGIGSTLVLGVEENANGDWTLYARTAGGLNHHVFATPLLSDGQPLDRRHSILFDYDRDDAPIKDFQRIHGRNLLLRYHDLEPYETYEVEFTDVTSCDPVLEYHWLPLDTVESIRPHVLRLVESNNNTFWLIVEANNTPYVEMKRFSMGGSPRQGAFSYYASIDENCGFFPDGAGGIHIVESWDYNGGIAWSHWNVHGEPAAPGFEEGYGVHLPGLSVLRTEFSYQLDGEGGLLYSWVDHRAGTQGAYSMRISDFSTLAAPEKPVTTPSEWVLHTPTPNPFNPSTMITVEVGSPGRMTLTVYDLLGREVVCLAEGTVSPGQHRYSWNGRSALGVPVTSGIYFLRLETADQVQVQKAVLLK